MVCWLGGAEAGRRSVAEVLRVMTLSVYAHGRPNPDRAAVEVVENPWW